MSCESCKRLEARIAELERFEPPRCVACNGHLLYDEIDSEYFCSNNIHGVIATKVMPKYLRGPACRLFDVPVLKEK